MSTPQGAVATPHYLATQAGNRAFQQGGTAVDAAIAAAAVLSVVYPHMCAIGGDIQALLAQANGTVRALSGSGAAARKSSAAALRTSHRVMPIHGVHPITVPGLVAAWGDLHMAGGSLPWHSLFTDAIELARAGVPVAAALGRDLQSLQDRLRTDGGLRGVFFHPDGRVLQTGEHLTQPALARSLEAIAQNGSREFYEGELAKRLVGGLNRLGSSLDLEDLAAHRSQWLDPLVGRFGGHEVMTAPPPAQGYVLLQLLAALELQGMAGADPLGIAASYLTRLCALTASERDQILGDPLRTPQDVSHWLSPPNIERLARHAQDLGRSISPALTAPRPDGDTVAIVAQDSKGCAVTVIQSIYHAFGSGVLEPETGIVCHNRGAAFTLDNGPATLTGGYRPPSTLTPALLRRRGNIEAALGAMGGKSQPQILAQILMRLTSGESAQAALAAPRWVVGTFGVSDEIVVLAEGAVPAESRCELIKSGMPLVIGAERDDRAGHAQFVYRGGSDLIESATDPRADGVRPS